MKNKFIIALLFLSVNLFAQHTVFQSQYLFDGLMLNPAYAGSKEALNVTCLYRNQWVGLAGSPKTMSLSGHVALKSKGSNVGFVLLNDKYGIDNHTKINLIYSYRFKLWKGEFSLGLQGTVDFYRANYDKIITTQNNDPNFLPTAQKQTIPDAGFGMYYFTKKIFAGVVIPKLLDYKNNSSVKYKPVSAYLGTLINLSDEIKVKPSFLVKYISKSPVVLDLNTTFYWKDVLGIGVGYRTGETFLACMDAKLNEQFRVGYCYEFGFSNLKKYSAGTHEIMLNYIFEYKINAKSSRYF